MKKEGTGRKDGEILGLSTSYSAEFLATFTHSLTYAKTIE